MSNADKLIDEVIQGKEPKEALEGLTAPASLSIKVHPQDASQARKIVSVFPTTFSKSGGYVVISFAKVLDYHRAANRLSAEGVDWQDA